MGHCIWAYVNDRERRYHDTEWQNCFKKIEPISEGISAIFLKKKSWMKKATCKKCTFQILTGL